MLYSEIINTLNDVEDNVLVEKIKYKGVKIWPLVRLELWKKLHQGDLNTPKKEVSLKDSFKETYRKIRVRILTYLEFFIIPFKKWPQTDAVFLISPLERNVKIKEKYYSRFSNSTEELLEEIGIAFTTFDLARKKLPVYGETIFLDREFATHLKKEGLKNLFRKEKDKFSNWDELKKYLSSKFPNIVLSRKNIEPLAQSILDYESFFETKLKKIKPKVCFLVCYYHSAGMGYIRACTKLGIKTVEIQHGEQHGMYREWNNVPKEGYDTMPSLFWCWGEESAQKINKWASATNSHKATVVGNPWISKFMNIKNKEKNDQKKNVLVGIPNKDLSKIENILEAFKNSPTNIFWHFSLHPRRLEGGDREKLAEKLKKTGNNNFEIKQASTGIIFEILSKMDFLITPWSTTAYEALALGVHPIITSGDDIAVFENYVKRDLFSFADTSEKILKIINKDKSEFNFKEETPYMETNREKMKKTILDLLGK